MRQAGAGWGSMRSIPAPSTPSHPVISTSSSGHGICRQQGAGVIIRGVRNRSDMCHEYQLAAMNQALGITTLPLPAKPVLAGMSSTVLRGLAS